MHRVETMKTLADAPTVIASVFNNVDFFVEVLSNVGDEKLIISAAVKRKPIRIAKTESENLGTAEAAAGKWIVRRNCVRRAVYINAQYLAEHGRDVLSVSNCGIV